MVTFHRPNLYGPSALGLDALVDFHLHNNPDYPFAQLTPRDGHLTTVTWREVAEAVHLAGRFVKDNIGPFDACSPPVVAIFAPDDGLVYTTIQLAIIRIGLIPLSISTRNSTAAVSHLLHTTSCSYLVAPEEQINGDMAPQDALGQQIASLRLLPEHRDLKLISQPRTSFVYARLESPGMPFVPDHNLQLLPALAPRSSWSTVMILHSSGSTKFPKPIYLHNTAFQEWLQAPYEGAQSITGKIISSMAYPKFHAGGVEICLVPTIAAGTIAGLFYPALRNEPVPRITSESVMDACLATGVNFLWLPPLTISEWANSAKGLQLMQDSEIVMIGGGPLPKEVGDRVVGQGVRLASVWGATEVGYVVEWPARIQGLDWQWQIPRKTVNYHFKPVGNNLFEIIITSCPTHHPSITRPLVGDEPTNWESRDIAEKHPTRPGVFRVLGRTDDQIVLSNAEKTNAGPIEDTIQSDAKVRGALLFGHGKPFNGVLIEPSFGHEVSADDPKAVDAFLNSIWPSIDAANSMAPSHSRLVRDMVIVIDPRITPLPRTPKHTVIRSAAWRLFASEIEQLYAGIEDDRARGDFLEVSNVSEFVSGVVHQVMGITKIREDYDLFSQGCDSLKATFIRHAIQRALNSSRIHDDRKLDVPYLLVYDFPTVQRLTEWGKTVLSGSDNYGSSESIDSRVTAIQDMVGKYSLAPRESQLESVGPQCAPIILLITGTTGALGSHMLSQAVDDCRIRRIYALGRASCRAQLQAKQKIILESRGLSSKFLGETKVVMVAAETLDDVPAEIMTEMKHTVTHIFHNSYPLNFNLGMAAFEPQFATVRALIDFAATSSLAVRPRIIFASSVGTLKNWQHPEWVPETKVDIETALGTGYGESKRVCELVLQSAADAAGLEIVNVRIGQLCGSRSTGDWNPTDWFPILVASCKYLACLPDSADVCAWLPTDTAAMAMLDIGFHERFDSSSRVIYRHLVHPRPSSWNRLVTHLSTLCARYLGHSVDLVSPDQWVNKIRNAASRPAEAGKIDAVKLIGLWTSDALAANIRPAREVLDLPRLQTWVTESESPALRSCEPTCEADVDKWFFYWMRHDLL